MEEIYQKVIALLLTIPELKWVDLDRGQMDAERPSVTFPCALLNMQIPRCEDVDHKKTKQACTVSVSIMLIFDFTGNTSAITPEAERAKSLNMFRIADTVYNTLQGWEDAEINPLTRTSVRNTILKQGYSIIEIPFTTEFIQTKD